MPDVGQIQVKQTEIDFGATPIDGTSFTITDPSVNPNSLILTVVSYDAPTGKDQDELEMDNLELRVSSGSGQFTLFAQSSDGSYLADKFKINYMVTG